MRPILLILLLTLSLLAKDKIALVIANKNYTNQTGLKNPIKDAKLIKATLEGMDFKVLEAYNKNLDDLGNKLEEFIAKARNAKVAVVYYAGHGIGVGSKNYLIPIGASNLSVDNLGRKLMSVDELKGAVANANGFGVVLFDACRNSFFSGTISGLSSGRASRALVQPTVKRGQNILVSFSTKAGEIAKDDVNNGEHSPYALALRDNLTEREDIRLVMGGVKDSVATLTNNQQEPISENSLGRKKACLAGCGYIPPKNIVTIDGLMYQNQPFTKKYTWQKAKEYCQDLTLGGYSNWRLPTRAELMKLGNIKFYNFDNDSNLEKWYDKNKYKRLKGSKGKELFVKKEFLENMQTGWYFWTSEEKDSSFASTVFFHSGHGAWCYKSSNGGYALCVR